MIKQVHTKSTFAQQRFSATSARRQATSVDGSRHNTDTRISHSKSAFVGGNSKTTDTSSLALFAASPSSAKFHRSTRIQIVAAKVKGKGKGKGEVSDAALQKEPHKYFDRVVISVKAGDGGRGELVKNEIKGKEVRNHKYHAGKNQKKTITLPPREPANGRDGGDVVLVVDPSLDSLLHLHERSQYNAQKGSNANTGEVQILSKKNRGVRYEPTEPLEIRVPPGTVVKGRKGFLLGDLTREGERLLVAKGGRGGIGMHAKPQLRQKSRLTREQEAAGLLEDVGEARLTPQEGKMLTAGELGEASKLELLLRVVADVGLVGLPNAGKSSLLARLTAAKPTVANYPFTTLMPNLGVLHSDTGLELESLLTAAEAGGATVSGEDEELARWMERAPSGGGGGGGAATLVDLPGLIEGAHSGRGLGREFLRHLRRTRVILHVLDMAVADPLEDYLTVRNELRMYNAEYCERPHIVALNKVDMFGDQFPEITAPVIEGLQAAFAESGDDDEDADGASKSLGVPPTAIVCCSAVSGEGEAELLKAIEVAMASLA